LKSARLSPAKTARGAEEKGKRLGGIQSHLPDRRGDNDLQIRKCSQDGTLKKGLHADLFFQGLPLQRRIPVLTGSESPLV